MESSHRSLEVCHGLYVADISAGGTSAVQRDGPVNGSLTLQGFESRVAMCIWLMQCTGRGLGGSATFIIMEHLNFSGRPSQSELGRKLAQMHLAEPVVSTCDIKCCHCWPGSSTSTPHICMISFVSGRCALSLVLHVSLRTGSRMSDMVCSSALSGTDPCNLAHSTSFGGVKSTFQDEGYFGPTKKGKMDHIHALSVARWVTSQMKSFPSDMPFLPQDDNARQGKFGFAVDNTIGGTPQPNGWMDNWVDFFRERRLRHQLNLANDGRLSDMGDKLMANLELLFDGVEVRC